MAPVSLETLLPDWSVQDRPEHAGMLRNMNTNTSDPMKHGATEHKQYSRIKFRDAENLYPTVAWKNSQTKRKR